MTDLPKHVDIHEEGPREGFQIEPGPISTADKIKLIDLFLGRLDRFAKSSGRNSYFEQVRDRELEASLLTPEREELHTSIIQLAA